ncbi:hypothetical protein TBLA_0F04180 [Henningerozyma blattae CBS 6284]|uniref:Arp2/3 complex 34 kDa subunit n=1 Tax=Henningerozyma blattae (strain ATCC 34711 / CBS 6284 / DSM 70876 / NBRC 10599 / NRRL Y-10934 / UCD 77-7) TaxID=1071380 RepID=I2H6E9_HENB6|nr:hypothetical protein TBLA_0F04180 [Tetrapisispora blattae CBS 6284]CCH61951.1 hypothetical protein TBLA_0F04180 [Tetrapisispora blattae CBS 6284]
MLHLDPHNLLLQKTLAEAREAQLAGRPLTLDRIVSDFDYTTFHVSNAPEDKSMLWVSIRSKAYQTVASCGSTYQSYLKDKLEAYPGIQLSSQTEAAYDISLIVDLNKLTQEGVVYLSLLKVLVVSYPFHLAFEEFDRLSKIPVPVDEPPVLSDVLFNIKHRDNEQFFVKPSNDRVTVIFETIFEDETDKIFGKVFLQEFVDARKRNRNIQSSPQVLVSHEPPLEVQNFFNTHRQQAGSDSDQKKYITFVLFPRHFQTSELQFSTICHLALFRNYFHYHIKCSKAYMHSRMRYRVNTFVKVLNRAKLDDEDEEDAENKNGEQEHTRKTISGRKMVY